jgi:hypothetical protein
MDEDAPNELIRLQALEHGQMGMRTQLDDITTSLNSIIFNLDALTRTPAPAPAPPPIPLAPPAPPATALTQSRLKPATPGEYDGNRVKGCAFYNSCMLYMRLCAAEFPDDQAKINWVLSYMKGGRAAIWADWIVRYDSNNTMPRFATWELFASAFRSSFFPENEATDARMRLESSQYFQGKRSVDAYVDEFEDLIELSGYTDKLNTVVKFRRGLQPAIQDKIAETGKDRPADDNPEGWYESARLFDQNRRANEAFHSSAARRTPLTSSPAPPTGNQTRSQPLSRTPWLHSPAPTLSTSQSTNQPARPLPPGIPMDIDAAKRGGKVPGACYRCGEIGHRARDCPTGFDIRQMSSDDRDQLLEDLLALKDASNSRAGSTEGTEDAEDEDFVRRSG